MKKINLLFIFISLLLSSCTQNEIELNSPSTSDPTSKINYAPSVSSGMLSFESFDAIFEYLDEIEELDDTDLRNHEEGLNFTSFYSTSLNLLDKLNEYLDEDENFNVDAFVSEHNNYLKTYNNPEEKPFVNMRHFEHPFVYVINNNGMLIVGETIYKLFDNDIIVCTENTDHIEKLSVSNDYRIFGEVMGDETEIDPDKKPEFIVFQSITRTPLNFHYVNAYNSRGTYRMRASVGCFLVKGWLGLARTTSLQLRGNIQNMKVRSKSDVNKRVQTNGYVVIGGATDCEDVSISYGFQFDKKISNHSFDKKFALIPFVDPYTLLHGSAWLTGWNINLTNKEGVVIKDSYIIPQ